MQNLNIRAEAISNVDIANRNQIYINITGADLDFLSDIPIKDIIRELDSTDKILEELNIQDIIGYLEYRGFTVEEL